MVLGLRRPLTGIVVCAVAASLAGCGGVAKSNVYGWKAATHEASRITLVVITGPEDKLVEGEVISESDSEVVVDATVRRASGSQPGNGVFRETDVELKSPIGHRGVYNRDGSVVVEQRSDR